MRAEVVFSLLLMPYYMPAYDGVSVRQEEVPMPYKGVVKGHVIELEGEVTLPEGMRVSIIPEPPSAFPGPPYAVTLHEWLQEARQMRAQLPTTSDSVELLRQLREERAHR